MLLVENSANTDTLNRMIREHYWVYRSIGGPTTGQVLYTGYFEPILDGRTVRQGAYQYPVYGRPNDLAVIDLSLFSSKYKGDRIIGLEHIKFFHLNDSKHDLGENKDRHEHIGRGFIGEAGFANFVNDPRWAEHPAHLETPKTEKDEDGNEIEMDPVNLSTLRSLIKA